LRAVCLWFLKRERVDERGGGSRCLVLCLSLSKSDKNGSYLCTRLMVMQIMYIRLWISTLVNRRGGVYVIDMGALHVSKGGVRLLASLFL